MIGGVVASWWRPERGGAGETGGKTHDADHEANRRAAFQSDDSTCAADTLYRKPRPHPCDKSLKAPFPWKPAKYNTGLTGLNLMNFLLRDNN